MSDTYFDDENYNDGFNEDSFEHGIKFDLWKRLLAYALHYRRDVLILMVCAFMVATAEVAFPMITRSVIDDVASKGADIDLRFYAGLCLCLQLWHISVCRFWTRLQHLFRRFSRPIPQRNNIQYRALDSNAHVVLPTPA